MLNETFIWENKTPIKIPVFISIGRLRLTLLTEPGELGDEALIEEATDGGCCCCWGGWEEKLKGGGC